MNVTKTMVTQEVLELRNFLTRFGCRGRALIEDTSAPLLVEDNEIVFVLCFNTDELFVAIREVVLSPLLWRLLVLVTKFSRGGTQEEEEEEDPLLNERYC